MTAQREWFEKDFYKVLGVTEKATGKEIKAAYRKLSKQYHPDASGGNEERFKEISAAFDVIGDPAKRKEYDEVRRLGPMAAGFGGMGGAGGAGNPFQGFTQTFRVDDLGDLLGGVFGGGRRGRGGPGAGRGPAGPRRGDDLDAELHLSFVEAVHGVETSVNVVSDAGCTVCGGTGAAPGTSPVICSTCGGRGVRDENQGLFSFSQPCRDCRGTGMRIETPCRGCRGSGIVHRPRRVKVRIPAGVQDGQKIRIRGRGAAGANGGPSGDLYVTVHVGSHPLFGRKGKDLTLTVPVTFPEAALGATVRVPTLDGPVTLRIPAGTATGKTFRVRGRGSAGGDLLVTVDVAVPAKVSDAEREAIEALAAATTESPRSHLDSFLNQTTNQPTEGAQA
ncbi:MAG TPA: molecular chaperone DnaJ [Acidimicrobiales bacterium]|nr:molecular chaperone DnaJ [Acidimicrobiales bacterium]